MEKAWIFHGHIFDITLENSTYLTKLGSVGYEILIRFNQIINFFSVKFFKKKNSIIKEN